MEIYFKMFLKGSLVPEKSLWKEKQPKDREHYTEQERKGLKQRTRKPSKVIITTKESFVTHFHTKKLMQILYIITALDLKPSFSKRSLSN